MDMTARALPNEGLLVTRAVREPDAFGPLYDHYFPPVYNYIRYRVQDSHLTDDLTAQTFERALVNLRRYRPERAPLGPWLFGIARHVVNDHFRAQQRRRWLPWDALRGRSDGRPQPDEQAVRQEAQDALLAALGQLKARERDLIALKFAAGLTNRRIAELTRLSESNVGVILYRAVGKLRAILDAQEADHE